jgi:hypothetical protein
VSRRNTYEYLGQIVLLLLLALIAALVIGASGWFSARTISNCLEQQANARLDAGTPWRRRSIRIIWSR